MSGVTGKRDNQLVKGGARSSIATTGAKTILLFHKASLGEKSIPFSSLNMPPEIADYTNPTSTEIVSLNLGFYRENVSVYSSTRGKLIPGLNYQVRNTQISFINSFESQLAEIFTVEVRNNLIGGSTLVDARSLRATGTLPAGQTVFNVGETFRVNYAPNKQVGAIVVSLNGVLQMRNAGNAPASPSADGNYHEVDLGNGTGIQIEFNNSEAYDQAVVVYSLEGMIERPNVSMMQHIENVSTKVDAIIPVLASLTDRVGRVMMTTNTGIPPFFISAMGSSIGNDSSGADHEGAEYRDLYDILWAMDGTTDDADAVYQISSAKGASASADWIAGKTITIDHSKNGGVFWRANTSGRDLGSYQEDAFQGHRHEPLAGSGSHFIQLQPGTLVAGGTNYSAAGTTGNPVTDSVNGTPRTADETRPKNVSYIAVICYKKFDESFFSVAPNSVDLRAFGDTVANLKNLYDSNQKLSNYVSEATATRYLKKFLPSTITSNTADILPLKYSGLVIGRTYKVQLNANLGADSGSGTLVAIHDGNIVAVRTSAKQVVDGGNDQDHASSIGLFVATSTELSFSVSGSNFALVGDSSITGTWILLEEKPNYVESSDLG